MWYAKLIDGFSFNQPDNSILDLLNPETRTCTAHTGKCKMAGILENWRDIDISIHENENM